MISYGKFFMLLLHENPHFFAILVNTLWKSTPGGRRNIPSAFLIKNLP